MNTVDEAQDLTDRIYLSLERRNGLCIRCLTKPLLTHVLSFLGGTKSSASVVCKYWYLCCLEAEGKGFTSNKPSSRTHVTNGYHNEG
jgi:hypothetical protein